MCQALALAGAFFSGSSSFLSLAQESLLSILSLMIPWGGEGLGEMTEASNKSIWGQRVVSAYSKLVSSRL